MKRRNRDHKKRANTIGIFPRQFISMLIGIFVSTLPIFVLPFYKKFLTLECNILREVISSPEIIFIGVAFSVSVANDYLNSNSKNKTILILLIIWNIIGSLFYVITKIAIFYGENHGQFNYTLSIIINVIFLAIILIIAVFAYSIINSQESHITKKVLRIGEDRFKEDTVEEGTYCGSLEDIIQEYKRSGNDSINSPQGSD